MNKVYPIAVITTVYNRKKELTRLYESLNKQSNKKFVWIIIDDGSKESLKNIVKKWQRNSSFPIIFKRKNNNGKVHAYKYAVNLVNASWSIVVDSDDVVSDNMIDILYSAIEKIDVNQVGAIFPRQLGKCKDNNEVWNTLPKSINVIELRYKYNIPESAILINHKKLSEVFSQLKLPNEKFISEEIIYNKFINLGKFLVVPELFYYGEYQEDGLTKNIFNLWKKNPKSTILLLRSRYIALSSLNFNKKIIGQIKTILNLNAFCLAKNISILNETPNLKMSMLLYFPSVIFKKIRFK